MARARSGRKWGGVLLGTLLLSGVGLAGPGKGQGRGRMGEGTGGSGSCEQFRTLSQNLENQARSLAASEGCSDVSQCKSAAVGAMACGGPRDYLVYCAATTDEDTLLRTLSQLQRSEEQANQQCGSFSICIFVSEPQVELVNGVCQKAEPESGSLP
jgi:hypothetical protein